MIKKSAILVGVLLVLAISMFIIRKNSVSSGNPKLPLNDSFEYPFLGSVRCHSKVEEVVLLNKEGKTTPMQVKTTYNENGHFLRAEFTKANSRGQEFPVREQESFLAQGLQKIDGLPSGPPKLDAQRVLNHLNRGCLRPAKFHSRRCYQNECDEGDFERRIHCSTNGLHREPLGDRR